MREEHRIVRLAKPVKKGLLHLVFSRFLIIFLLMGLQVGVFVVLYGWLAHLSRYTIVAQTVFTGVVVIYLFNNEMDTSAKLTWLFLISLFPLPGAALLSFTQTNLGHRNLKQQVDRRIQESKKALLQPEVLHDGDELKLGAARLKVSIR